MMNFYTFMYDFLIDGQLTFYGLMTQLLYVYYDIIVVLFINYAANYAKFKNLTHINRRIIHETFTIDWDACELDKAVIKCLKNDVINHYNKIFHTDSII